MSKNPDQKTIPIPRRPGQSAPGAGSAPPPGAGLDQNFHYRALFEQIEDCVFIISFDLRYMAVNPQAVRLLGYSEQELIGKPVSDILYQDAHAATESILGSTSNLVERLMRCKDGSIIPVEIRTSIVYDQGGSPAYVQTIARDISERKASENSLRYRNRILSVINDAAERLLRSSNIQEEIPEILQLLGGTNDLAMCAVIRAREADHFENGFEVSFEWRNPAATPFDLQKITHYLLSSRSDHFRDLFINARVFTAGSGDFPPVSIAFIPILEADHAWGFIGLLAPETQAEWDPVQREAIRTAANIIAAALEHQLTEEQIYASEQRSRTILAALPDLIVRVDRAGNVLDYAARQDHPLYQPRETVNGKKLADIWDAEIFERVVGSASEALTLAAPLRKQFQLPDTHNVYEVQLEPLGPSETLIIIRDISDEARLNRMKSDFINRASHELRTPLTTAILMCELIQGGGEAAEQAEYWQILISELNRQKSLIDRLLMAGRLESGKLILEPETMDLKPILEESILAVKSIAKKRSIEIELSAPAGALMVWGDHSGLQQVFINLINNAAKFSPEGSRVRVAASTAAGQVNVAISDQGLGIPAEDLPNLFEQFFRARNVTLAEIPGSGVGLYIVKSIVEELKGSIAVDSQINKGTTFTITLNVMG